MLFKKLTSSFLLCLLFSFFLLSCSKEIIIDTTTSSSSSTPTATTISARQAGVVKILAIGNSFSEDAVESHLYDLAKAAGREIIIGNLYIGGASFQLHVINANKDAEAYQYRKIDINGVRKNTVGVSIYKALLDEQWDYISFQQASNNSGQFETFKTDLPPLYEYVKKNNPKADTKYILHQTWAYAQQNTVASFANYGKDQLIMYNAIVDAYIKAKALINASLVIPSGTAIQNARTSIVGDNYCRDGYHLAIPDGRYTASCTWFESIFGINVINNSYYPSNMTIEKAKISQIAAHNAVLSPNKITSMGYSPSNAAPTKTPSYININFGTATASGWNSVRSAAKGTSVVLNDATNKSTGITLEITERFNASNTSGEKSTTTSFNMPSTVSSGAFYGNAKAAHGGVVITKSTIKLSGLDKNIKYNLCYFVSRSSTSDNRETKFTAVGSNTNTVSQNASNNKTNISCSENIQPNSAGEIILTITKGDNNNNSVGFYYLNAMRITPVQ